MDMHTLLVVGLASMIMMFQDPDPTEPVLVPFDYVTDIGDDCDEALYTDGSLTSYAANCESVHLCFNEPTQIDRVRHLSSPRHGSIEVDIYNYGGVTRTQSIGSTTFADAGAWYEIIYPGEMTCVVINHIDIGAFQFTAYTMEVEAYTNWPTVAPIAVNTNQVFAFLSNEIVGTEIVSNTIYVVVAVGVLSFILAAVRVFVRQVTAGHLGEQRSRLGRDIGNFAIKRGQEWWDRD